MASKESAARNRTGAVTIDAAVLAGCRSGDRDAQQRLYELCHHQAHHVVAPMVGSQNAADVTQQVFLQLFRKIDQFSGHSRFETWLYRLAVNEALQYLRKDQRWRKMHSLAHEPMSRHERSERHEQKELLELALLRTDPDLRAVFILREMEGLSYCEIAEAIDVPKGTVGSRLNRARRELQQHLTDLGWEP